ncbi:MAG: tetratricopeptide repeat protein [Bacteroidales bacterium]|nr:tetratricopeptide repeat protein [Bacteroidales bacterium]
MANNKNVRTEREQNVAEAVSKTELFFENNKKTIAYIVAGIIVVAALVFAWINLITIPKQKEAVDQLFTAERYFRTDSFNLALNGDGNALGFKQVIDKYGKKAGQAAYFDAGVCCLRLGDNDGAISYLKKYSTKDKIMQARAKACIGDAYVNKGDVKSAVSYFESAAATADNILAAGYLLKLGLCQEELGQPAEAVKAYQKIKDLYGNSPEGYEIDKYISRAEAAIK